MLGELVVHEGADALSYLFAGDVDEATDLGANGAFGGPEFLDGLGLKLDDVLDQERVNSGAGAFDVYVTFAIGVQAQILDALLDLLFPLLAGVLDVLEGVLTGGADVR